VSRSEALAKRLDEVLCTGGWIANTNYRRQLTGLTWQQATQPIGSLNTIAALTFHINYYLAGLLSVLKGGKLEIRDKYSFEAPPVESAADWERLRDTFFRNAERFVEAVAQLPEDQLDAPFVDAQYGTYQRNLEGVIEHSYYHLGQISLLAKMITASEAGDPALDR
jgi:uncharacterized damage-inducible protein DinB